MNHADICISDPSEKTLSKAQEVGWDEQGNHSTELIEAEDWGELKQKIRENREENHVIVFLGGDEKLNRKAVSDPRVDVLLHPGKGRKDSGFDEPMAEKAAENNVALGLDFRMLSGSDKRRVHMLSNWRKNLKLCEKHDAPYLITTAASQEYEIRAPRDLEAFINSLGFSGRKALEKHVEILEKNTEKLEEEDMK